MDRGRRTLSRIFRPSPREEVDEEFRFHVEMVIRDHSRKGLSREAAEKAALERFGDIDAVKAACRASRIRRDEKMGRRDWWQDVGQDIRFALRHFRKNPTFAAVAVLTLALGIGANTAVFSAVHGVLLRPLPFAEPDRLVRVYSRFQPESGFTRNWFTLSPAAAVDYRRDGSTLERLGYYAAGGFTLTGGDAAPQRVRGVRMNVDLLPVLGVQPLLGRWFSQEEDLPGASPVAILGHGLWASRFGSDPGVVGRSITVNSVSTEIVGVMPPGFVIPGTTGEVFLTFGLDEENPGARGTNYYLNAIGRLSAGATLEQAGAELESLVQGWREDYGHPGVGETMFLIGLHRDAVRSVSGALWMLMAAVALVLIIGSANVVNLLLAQGEARTNEVSLRAALGAARSRIAMQLLTESLVLAIMGAALGVGLAALGLWALRFINPGALPRMDEIGISIQVLGFTALVTVGAALLFGLVPALQAGGGPGAGRRAAGSRTVGDRLSRRVRSALVMGEVALSVVVVVCAGLVARSFGELMRVDTGMETEGRLTFSVGFPPNDYPTSAGRVAFVESLLERIEAIPGVSGAEFTSNLPLSGNMWFEDPQVQGRAATPEGESPLIGLAYAVSPGYLESMGIEVIRGRGFQEWDGAESAPVALVSQEAARTFWPDEDPLGSLIGLQGQEEAGRPWISVVGVVDDTRPQGLQVEPRPQFYFLYTQSPAALGSARRSGAVVVRSIGGPLAMVPPLRRAVAELDRNMPLTNLRTMEDLVSNVTAGPRFTSGLLGTSGLLALVLAMVGVYGVVSYSVARRTREIGVRMALGARKDQVIHLMVKEGVRPALLGVGLGVLGALLATELLEGMLFQVSTTDPLTFVTLPLLLLSVAVLASWIPARRSSGVTPVEALREE